jgi:hypothetical protein
MWVLDCVRSPKLVLQGPEAGAVAEAVRRL